MIKDQYAVSKGLNTPYSRYGTNIIFWNISNMVSTLRNHQYASLSLDTLRSPDFNLLSDEEYSEEEEEEEAMDLRENTFSGSDNEDANEHIEKVLKIVDLFHVPNITNTPKRPIDKDSYGTKLESNGKHTSEANCQTTEAKRRKKTNDASNDVKMEVNGYLQTNEMASENAASVSCHSETKSEKPQFNLKISPCVFCHSSKEIEGTEPLVCYAQGKRVKGDVPKFSKVTYVHEKCIACLMQLNPCTTSLPAAKTMVLCGSALSSDEKVPYLSNAYKHSIQIWAFVPAGSFHALGLTTSIASRQEVILLIMTPAPTLYEDFNIGHASDKMK
ncbi:hypothetical protein Tco_1555412 [Tanacetum coccineum]